MMAVSPLIESAKVCVPKEAPWLATFQHELVTFPNGKHDDQVDSMSQFLGWAKNKLVQVDLKPVVIPLYVPTQDELEAIWAERYPDRY
jgi:phage terminase large subunit-like protein